MGASLMMLVLLRIDLGKGIVGAVMRSRVTV